MIVDIFTLIYFANIAFKPQIKEVMAQYHLLPEPENLTELYFEDHINLPKTIVRLETYGYTFTVHNLENKDMEYKYITYLKNVDKKILLQQGKFFLNNGEYKSITVGDLGPLKSTRVKIVVELLGRNQEISFWMEPSI